MKQNKDVYYWFLSFLLIAYAIYTVGGMKPNLVNEIDCDFGEIKYENMEGTNSTCWIGDSNEYCPLPQKFHCKIRLDTNPEMLMNTIRLLESTQ